MDDRETAAAARVVDIALLMNARIADLTAMLYGTLSSEIAELQGDPQILDLLATSITSNLETLTHVFRHDIPTDEVTAPPSAAEYARRLAQRGTPPNALLRAYRLGHEHAVGWALDRIAETEPDPWVAFRAGQLFLANSFKYVDKVSELVVAEYEAERVRWLSNRNTVRAATLAELLEGRPVDVAGAEAALGYRLRQVHLGVVVWSTDDRETSDLRHLERAVAGLAKALRSGAPPLFVPQDRSSGWAWISLGHAAPTTTSWAEITTALDLADGIRIAVGAPAGGPEGFRASHLDAERAREVAAIAQQGAQPITSYADPGVRAAALLAADLDSTRRLVRCALGPLAEDTTQYARLRETLLSFIGERFSYSATAERVHLHKNTVKYRVDKAIEARGRPLEADRLDLELALVACHWLGRAVLAPAA